MKCLLGFGAPHATTWERSILLLAIMRAFYNRSNHSYAIYFFPKTMDVVYSK